MDEWRIGQGMMGFGFGFGWPFMFLFPLAVIGLIVLGLYYLLSGQASSGGYSQSSQGDALQILKERYARGQITSGQYSQIKKELES